MSSFSIPQQAWYVRWPLVVWKFLVGIVFCQSALTAVLVVGWTSRLMRRTALSHWWRQNDSAGFAEYCATVSAQTPTRTLPNWFLAETSKHSAPPKGGRSRTISMLSRLFGSLASNFRLGLSSVLCILAFTLPATTLWLYSWVLGWNISFFKLYEQSQLGVSLGLFGILLFILAMLYVPMAHARQATTGNWRTFFQLRFNWQLIRRRPLALLPVAIAFVVVSFPVLLLRTAPYFVGSDPAFDGLSTEALRQWFDRYHLFAALVLLPGYVLVWLAVARTYAGAMAAEYATNPDDLRIDSVERAALARLPLTPIAEPRLGWIGRGTSWTWGRVVGTTTLTLTCLAWFGVAAEVYVAQFFNYIPGMAWLNHPLVLLPWIKHLPAGLIP